MKYIPVCVSHMYFRVIAGFTDLILLLPQDVDLLLFKPCNWGVGARTVNLSLVSMKYKNPYSSKISI